MKKFLTLPLFFISMALMIALVSCETETSSTEPTLYTVTVSDSIEHGKVTADKNSAEAGATVKLTATADSGYELDSYSVKDASANALTVTEGTFTMPKSNVTVSATFKETADTVNQKAAAAVIAKINAIGTVEYTSESKAKIDEARTAYDALTEAQKALVPEETLALLTAAESAYTELIAAAEQQNPSAIYQFHSTVTYLEAGTDGSAGTGATYAYFGDWPQTIKAESVTVDETKSVTRGSMTYYLGSDNNYYAKCTENACLNGYTYSDGTTVAQASANSEKYFKVEPIKWRVLNPSAVGNKILVAESILTANIPYYGSKSARTLNETTIYANNYKYSNIRAYLNGTKNQFVTDGGTATQYDVDWSGIGFLQTAFTSTSLIATTTVDNSAASINPASNASQWNSGTNDYACDDTSDKIFLLSEKEATTSDYGFTEYDQYGEGNSRIRVTTDYAKANCAWQSTEAGSGGLWWLRSPYYWSSSSYDACDINYNGTAERHDYVYGLLGGVVPALCLSN